MLLSSVGRAALSYGACHWFKSSSSNQPQSTFDSPVFPMPEAYWLVAECVFGAGRYQTFMLRPYWYLERKKVPSLNNRSGGDISLLGPPSSHDSSINHSSARHTDQINVKVIRGLSVGQPCENVSGSGSTPHALTANYGSF